jgi:hypothetical protein
MSTPASAAPLLRPDPAQIDRLRAIIGNLEDRIAEAEQANWLCEVEGLKNATEAAQKLAQMERAVQQRDEPVLLELRRPTRHRVEL